MRVGLEGDAALSDGFVRHIDTCLGCMACVTACPSGVQYDRLIEATRSQVERLGSRSVSDRLFRRFVLSVFPYPTRLRWVALGGWLYQKLGLQRLARVSGLLNALPARLRAMESIAPPLALTRIWARFPERVCAADQPRRRVGLILGCVQRVFFDEVNRATVRVLAAEGCEVVVPPGQGCCGALPMHTGIEQNAVVMARQTIETFEKANVDTIVINAAGCGSTIKQYGHLLRDDPVYADRAAAFADKCRDISELLAELGPSVPRHPLPLRVAYHDACHLQHAQGISAPPRAALATIPELEVCDIPEGGLCCGSAGIYSLVEPEAAWELGKRKAENILTTGADTVVLSNPGCLLQVRRGLAQAGRPLPVRHLVELVDASIRDAYAL